MDKGGKGGKEVPGPTRGNITSMKKTETTLKLPRQLAIKLYCMHSRVRLRIPFQLSCY